MREKSKLIMRCTVVVFCGGRATRVKRELRRLPKALVPLANEPYLVVLLKKLQRVGFANAIICTSPFTRDIVTELRKKSPRDLDIQFSEDSGKVENGGALWQAMKSIRTNTALCINGDTIVDLDHRTLVREHVKHRASVSIVVSSRADQPHPGGVVIRPDSWVDDIVEEELDRAESVGRKEGLRYMSNSGAYVVDREMLLKNWPKRFRAVKLETGLFRYLARKRRVWAFDNGNRYLLDFGSPDRLKKLRRNIDRIEKLLKS